LTHQRDEAHLGGASFSIYQDCNEEDKRVLLRTIARHEAEHMQQQKRKPRRKSEDEIEQELFPSVPKCLMAIQEFSEDRGLTARFTYNQNDAG
jgi:hypothetical protein